RHLAKSSVAGLGNAAREWLLTKGLTPLARVLDGLYTVDVKPNTYFTELEACQWLMPLKIGRRSIMAALKAIIADCSVFERGTSPLYPPIGANAAIGSDDLNNSCEMSRGAKRVKIAKRGRPARLYQLPSPTQVAEMIGIKTTASDAVPVDQFVSPRSYRMALHKQLLGRRPGHYAREWLGKRLGVSRWTTRRYEKAANIYVQFAYATQSMSWASASKLPRSRVDAPRGVFLEVASGKRYPAVRGLALKLMKQGYQLVLKQQQANYYAAMSVSVGIPTPLYTAYAETNSSIQASPQSASIYGNSLRVGIPTPQSYHNNQHPNVISNPTPVGIPTPPIPIYRHDANSSVGIPTPPQSEPTFWLCTDCLDFHVTVNRPSICTRCGCDCDWEVIPARIWRDAQALKHWWQQRYRDYHQAKREGALGLIKQPEIILTTEAKALAEKIHSEIPNFSWANARRVVSEFSEQLIEKALLVVKSRKGLRSPAGFMMSFLKSEHKLILNNNKSEGSQSSQPKGESAVEWVRRLAKSQYLSFIANADDILNFGLSHEPSPA
ncbi:MAG: hypothetical protein H0X30_28140, partial [Anaerolineae bacterium]|nr:hypothetical protein [Anaerolineae bacterium]